MVAPQNEAALSTLLSNHTLKKYIFNTDAFWQLYQCLPIKTYHLAREKNLLERKAAKFGCLHTFHIVNFYHNQSSDTSGQSLLFYDDIQQLLVYINNFILIIASVILSPLHTNLPILAFLKKFCSINTFFLNQASINRS